MSGDRQSAARPEDEKSGTQNDAPVQDVVSQLNEDSEPLSRQDADAIAISEALPDSKPADTLHRVDTRPYSIFTDAEKKLIVLCAGLCALFSPISGQIYFPSINQIASDLNVSISQVNLTITVYLIVQGIAPAFIGGFSDSTGRRPAYYICIVVYAAANLGLALQNSYGALMALRCLQSAGASGTVALAVAVTADIVTSQERGKYVAWVSVTTQAGPSLGPIIGGLLGQNLGWHSIFWFLLICVGAVAIFAGIIMPETNHKVVEDGSVPPPRYSWSYISVRVARRLTAEGTPVRCDLRDDLARKRKIRFPNPLETVKVVFSKQAGWMLLFIGLLSCNYYATVALIPGEFDRIYSFNEIQIALCYIPLGVGSVCSSLLRARLLDYRYVVHAKRLGVSLDSKRRVDLSDFPIERARLEIAVPLIGLGVASMIGFGFCVQYATNLAGPLVFLFFIGFCISAALNTVSTLLVDVYPGKAATATAANNLVRCLLGAAATGAISPMIDSLGVAYSTLVWALIVVVTSPILYFVMKKGPQWRREQNEKDRLRQASKMIDAA